MYIWYAVLFHRPRAFKCLSLKVSGKTSSSEGIPDLKLFPEMPALLQPESESDFFTILWKIPRERPPPPLKRKTGSPLCNICLLSWMVLSFLIQRTGQKSRRGTGKMSTLFSHPHGIFGLLRRIFIRLALKSKSFHSKSENFIETGGGRGENFR
jgi:hypothetical protein